MEETLLAQVTQAARENGHEGIALLKHPASDGKIYLAMCLGRNGRTCDPRNWDHHETPEAALQALLNKLKGTKNVGDSQEGTQG